MYNPVATYRLQFHSEFTFQQFEDVIDYLKKLGVSTIYASPVFEAAPGSMHGYDGTNPNKINPEIGTEEQLRNISCHLKKENIGWLQDIVPNHMAFHPHNEWLMDVLEKGPQSRFTKFFDIVWNNSELFSDKIMVPFLGANLEEVISKGELKVAYENGRMVFKYYENAFPLQPLSYVTVLRHCDKPIQAIDQFISQVPKTENNEMYSHQWEELKQQFVALMKNDAVAEYVNNCIASVNENTTILEQLVNEQSYKLCHWQETDKHINYRRFFTINGLICLNIQDKEVFETYHQLIKRFTDEDIFNGLRIDHIDGLYDPEKYLHDLRDLVGENNYTVVEKILEPGERLPEDWPVAGTTGYDFLGIVNNLFTNSEAEKKIYKVLPGTGTGRYFHSPAASRQEGLHIIQSHGWRTGKSIQAFQIIRACR